MQKTLDELYVGIGEAGTGRSGVAELRALAALSANLYTLVCVAPWLEERYGSARELHGRIREAAAALVFRLERETDAVERVLGANALFVCSNTATEYEQKVLDFAEPLIARCEAGFSGAEAALFEAEACRLMCHCHCLVGDETLAAEARAIVARWTESLNEEGTWTDIPAEAAFARCEAAAAYADYTGDERFGRQFIAAVEPVAAAAKGAETLFRVVELRLRNGSPADAQLLSERIGPAPSAGSDRVSLAYRLAADALCELHRIDHVPSME